jgi:hypothetical protein
MSKGVNRLSGRNNNKMDLNPDGSVIVSSVGSSITFNTDTPLQINSIESFTEKTSIVIPNLNQTSSNFEVTVDIIPSTNSKPTGSLTETKPTPEPNLLTLENQFLPDIEENFNFVNLFTNDNINIEEITYSEGIGIIIDQIKPATSNNCKTRYPEFKFQEKPSANYLTYKEAKTYLKSKYSDSIAKAVFAIIWSESSKTGTAFRSSGGYNYSGVQTDDARWSAPGIIGQFCTRDEKRYRAFGIFKDNNSFLDFMANRAKKKGFDGTNASKWARAYLNSWVYFNLEKQDKKVFDKTLPGKIAIYNTAIKNFNS